MGKWIPSYGFGFKGKVILLAMVFIILSDEVVHGKLILSKQKLAEINRKLKLLNKPAVKSIKSEDGDIIDCVDIYKQPAFDHPALRNHTIQMRPSNYPPIDTTAMKHGSPTTEASQLWRKSGSCPDGTIPIRRTRKRDLLRADSIENYGRKRPITIQDTNQTYRSSRFNDTSLLGLQLSDHSTAVVVAEGYSYSGAKADLNVWNPYIEKDDEYSSSQIWLRAGPYFNFESIECGWVVHPSLFGDRRTRLFTYWTADGTKTTGCFNLNCAGFVQTSTEIALGAVIDHVSAYNGPQYHITIYIVQDKITGDWWLNFGAKAVGYWPGNLFETLKHMATYVKFGADVHSKMTGERTPHTSTAMGNGEHTFQFGFASFIRYIRIIDNSLTLKYPDILERYVDEYDCYSAKLMTEYLPEPEFYFGGTGRNFRCP